MAQFAASGHEVYIADYEHLGVYACRILVPGMSDIYPVEDLHMANNAMGIHLRETILALPENRYRQEDYLSLLAQLDEEGHDDFTRVRELLGIAAGKDNGWSPLRIGELKSMLALAGGDTDQALAWVEWTQDFNASVLSAARANYYRCLHTLLLLTQEPERDTEQYLPAFARMYGQETLNAALDALNGKNCFFGLRASDNNLTAFPAHQALLAAYEKLQKAKSHFWLNDKNAI